MWVCLIKDGEGGPSWTALLNTIVVGSKYIRLLATVCGPATLYTLVGVVLALASTATFDWVVHAASTSEAARVEGTLTARLGLGP